MLSTSYHKGGSMSNNIKMIQCPYCGYKMPIKIAPYALCKGVFVRCKGKHCKKEFEIIINENKEIK